MKMTNDVRIRAALPRRFSLLELLIAVAILALAIGASLSVTSQAKSDFLRARERWGKQHSLEQALEFYLLAEPGIGGVPEGLLPPGYVAGCDIRLVEDGLPEHALTAEGGWVLSEYRVSVHDDQGQFLGERRVRKLLREDLFK